MLRNSVQRPGLGEQSRAIVRVSTLAVPSGFAGQEDAQRVFTTWAMHWRGWVSLNRRSMLTKQVLEIDAGNEDAQYNRDLVKDRCSTGNKNLKASDKIRTPRRNPGAEGNSPKVRASRTNRARKERQGDPRRRIGEILGDSSRSEDEMTQEDLEAIRAELERAAQEAARQQQGEAQATPTVA